MKDGTLNQDLFDSTPFNIYCGGDRPIIKVWDILRGIHIIVVGVVSQISRAKNVFTTVTTFSKHHPLLILLIFNIPLPFLILWRVEYLNELSGRSLPINLAYKHRNVNIVLGKIIVPKNSFNFLGFNGLYPLIYEK